MKKCFSVLLIIVFVMQEPSLSNADYFARDVYLSKQAYLYLSTKKAAPDLQTTDDFKITYYVNGGIPAIGNPIEYKREDLPIVLEAPIKEGYNFAGWYTDSHFSNKIISIDSDTASNYTLYAKWTRCIDGDYNVQMYSYQNSAAADQTMKKLKDCDYSFLENVKIPGMPSTREEDVQKNRITDTSQCPQGICITDDYLLVSSYSTNGSGNLGCIYLFDRVTGNFLAALGMKKDSHLGGITFDGKNIWVCHSDNNTLECIPYSFVRQVASRMPQSVVDCSTVFQEFHVLNPPSCIAYYDGLLWVATHTKLLKSKMIAYEVTDNGLRQMKSCQIPDKVQGIVFDEEGRVYLSTSYGRKKSSFLKAYASVEALDKKPGHPLVRIEMPPCSEEIALAGGQIYVLFESAGEKYFEGTDGKGMSISPIDEVLVLAKDSIFQ